MWTIVLRVSASSWLMIAENYVLPFACSAIAVALAGVAIPDIVDEVGSDGPGVPGGNTFRVVDQTPRMEACPGNCKVPACVSFCKLPRTNARLFCVI